MNSISIRQSLDEAVNTLMCLTGGSMSAPVTAKLRSAYRYLQVELAEIDQAVLDALTQEVA